MRVRADQTATGIEASLVSRNELGAIGGAVVSTYESMPLSGVFVEAKSDSAYGQAVSDASGCYKNPELPTGDYTVTYTPGDGHLDVHFDSFSLELATRTVGLDSGVLLKGADARLIVDGLIRGSVEAEHPIDGESWQIRAYRWNGLEWAERGAILCNAPFPNFAFLE